jgi:hypothetical protein
MTMMAEKMRTWFFPSSALLLFLHLVVARRLLRIELLLALRAHVVVELAESLFVPIGDRQLVSQAWR